LERIISHSLASIWYNSQMIERLQPPKGPWKRTLSPFGPEFVHDSGINPESDVKTWWRKSVSKNAETVARFDEHQGGTLDRWVMESINPAGRQILYTIRDRGDRNQYLQLAYAGDRFQGLSIITELDVAKRPAFLNVNNIGAVYALDGAIASIRVHVDSQSRFDEEKYRTKSSEDNLRELIQIFKESGPQAATPYAPSPDQKVSESIAADIHDSVVSSFVKGKLMQWIEAEKKKIDEDLDIIPQAIESTADDTLNREQIHGMSNFLSAETIKALPDDYPKLEGEQREDVFDQAFDDAMLQSFKLHDHSLQIMAQHTVVFALNNPKLDENIFAVFQGNPTNPFSAEGLMNFITGEPTEVGSAHSYEDKQYALLRQEDFMALFISSKLNSNQRMLYLSSERLQMDKLLPIIKTEHSSEWMKAYDLARASLTVVPA